MKIDGILQFIAWKTSPVIFPSFKQYSGHLKRFENVNCSEFSATDGTKFYKEWYWKNLTAW